MGDDEDIDRAAILARRQQFVVMTLAVLGSGCHPSTSSEAPPDPRCVPKRAELEQLPEPRAEDDPAARAEHARVRLELALDHNRMGCWSEAIQALEASYAIVPDGETHRLAYELGLRAYRFGDLTAARRALTLYVEHYPIEDGERLDRRHHFYRSAKRTLRDIDAGRPYKARQPKPQACLRMSDAD